MGWDGGWDSTLKEATITLKISLSGETVDACQWGIFLKIEVYYLRSR